MKRGARWRINRYRSWERLLDLQAERLFDLQTKGLSLRQIASELGTSPFMVQKMMKAAQVRRTLQQVHAALVEGEMH